jgi:hypothetical protein
MATITFYGGEGATIVPMTGSGLGFYGPGGFGTSVRVNEWQDNTYITDSAGAVQGTKCDNVKYAAPGSGEIAGSTILALRDIPNQLATLNIRFTHPTAVKTSNAYVRTYDRVSINNPPSGCQIYLAEAVHPWADSQPTGPLGSGSTTWKNPGGSGGTVNAVTYDTPLALAASPGTSGLSPSGSNTVDAQHDWYVMATASPDSLSAHLAALYFTVEYQ